MRSLPRKFCLALALAAMLACLPAQAQRHSRVRRMGPPTGRADASPEQRVKNLDGMLNLLDDQKTKLLKIFQDEDQQLTELGNNLSLSADERQAKSDAIQESARKAVRGVLTEEQQKKLDQVTAPKKPAQ